MEKEVTVMIVRKIQKELAELAREYKVITITGPRQSGKTTLIRNEFAELPYYSLENDYEDLEDKYEDIKDEYLNFKEHSRPLTAYEESGMRDADFY